MPINRQEREEFMEDNKIKSLEELQEELVEKLNKELYDYRQSLLERTPQEVIDSAYELVCRQEISDYLVYDRYHTRPEFEALLESEDILKMAYQDWLSFDGNLREMLEYSTDETIEDIMKERNKDKEKDNKNKNVR